MFRAFEIAANNGWPGVVYEGNCCGAMSAYDFDIPVTFRHRIRFTKRAFDGGNPVVRDLLGDRRGVKVLVLVETEVLRHFPALEGEITEYLEEAGNAVLTEILTLPGGEECKVGKWQIMQAMRPIERNGIDRHSFVFAIGGGAFLDMVGLAAATAHRGVRLVRFPTTTLSQDDSGVGVKNGINAFGKKNFIGTFAVPYAVVNDFRFLDSQPEETRRGGLAEVVKVALVKDAALFGWLEEHAGRLGELEPAVMEEAVERSAVLHARHIAEGGDPFETGSSRPLDFGHWSAHKMEQLTGFELSHAEAVSVGVAADTLYSARSGWLASGDALRVIRLLKRLRLPVWHEAIGRRDAENRLEVVAGLEEFREHLGGELTILMLRAIGEGFDVHELDADRFEQCLCELRAEARPVAAA